MLYRGRTQRDYLMQDWIDQHFGQPLTVTKVMISLSQAHQQLQVISAPATDFFTDWFENLPNLLQRRNGQSKEPVRVEFADSDTVLQGVIDAVVRTTNCGKLSA